MKENKRGRNHYVRQEQWREVEGRSGERRGGCGVIIEEEVRGGGRRKEEEMQ